MHKLSNLSVYRIGLVNLRFHFRMLDVLALYTNYFENFSHGLHKYTFTRVIGVQKLHQISLALLCASEKHAHARSTSESLMGTRPLGP